MFLKLKKEAPAYNVVNVDWLMKENDEDLRESGELYEQLTGFPFNFIVID